MGDQRRFTEEQVKAIMMRAIELEQSPQAGVPQSGVDLKELEEMAGELGVPRESLHAAIVELDTHTPSSRTSRVLGEVTVETVHRTIPVALTPEHQRSLANSLPALLGLSGQAPIVGRSIVFQASEFEVMRTGTRTQLVVHAGAAQTTLSLTEDSRYIAGGVFGGIVGGIGAGVGFGVGLGVGFGVLQSVLFATLFPPGALLASFFGARALYRAIVRGRRRKSKEMLDQVARAISDNGPIATEREDTLPPQ